MEQDSTQADDGRYDLALAEGRRALERQADELESIRGRAISLVGVGGLSAAFVGGLAARDEASVSVWSVLAAGAFVLLVIASGVILWPWEFNFAMYADELAAWAYEGDAIPDMEREAATYMGENFRSNSETLDLFVYLYVVGLFFLLVEIALLLLDLRG